MDDALRFRGVEVTVAEPQLMLDGVAGPPELVVTGDRSTWSLADEVVAFTGNVRATRGDVVLTAERLTLRYAGGRLVDAHAEGAVRVERGARTATAERADLDAATGRIALQGRPELRDGPHRMTGDAMALWLDDDRMECERCRLVVDGAALDPR